MIGMTLGNHEAPEAASCGLIVVQGWQQEALHPTDERSLRRALRRLVDDKVVMIQGSGGRRDPFRYVIHPVGLVGTGDREGIERLEEWARLQEGASTIRQNADETLPG